MKLRWAIVEYDHGMKSDSVLEYWSELTEG